MDVRFEYAVHANALQIVVYFVLTFFVIQHEVVQKLAPNLVTFIAVLGIM